MNRFITLALGSAAMRSAQSNRNHTAGRRRIAGTVVFAFVAVFFALPLYSALTLCAMPCCEHHNGEETAVSAAMGACEQTCASAADEAAPPQATSFAPEQRANNGVALTPIAVPVESSASLARTEEPSVDPRRAVSTPLHVLNSIFRI